MLRPIYLLVTFILFFTSCKGQESRGLKIKSTISFSPNQQEALKDMKQLWSNLGFQDGKKGFMLTLKKGEANASINREEITFTPTGKRSLQIKSPTKEGLILGLYSWLEHIGFRFYGPGEEWTYIPSKVSYSDLKWDTIIQPRFSLRYITPVTFGTKEYPKLKLIKADWEKWYRRLRLGNPNHLTFGHYGAKFNVKYKEQIKAHPEWRALVNGKRKPWSRNVKLCYTNKEVQQLYIEDALKRLQEKKESGIKPPYYINMEPPDFDGFCQCSVCQSAAKKLSDNIFRLANMVARALKKEDSDARVLILAYNTHALPPSFPLKDNVAVTVASDYGVEPLRAPEEVLNAWLNTSTEKLFYRGYLAITMLNHDLPLSKARKQYYLNRIDFLIENGFDGFNWGVSYSYGATGWLQYVLTHKAWDPNFNVDQARHDFLENLFPGYVNEMKKFFEYLELTRDYKSYIPSAQKILENILASQPKDSLMIERIKDLHAYLAYIKRYHQWQAHKKTKSVQQELVQQIEQMYRTKMVNTASIYRNLKRKDFPKLNLVESKASNISNQSFSIKKLRKTNSTPVQLKIPKAPQQEAVFPQWTGESSKGKAQVKFYNDVSALLYVSQPNQTINIPAKHMARNASGGWSIIELKTLEGKLVQSEVIEEDETWKTYKFAPPKPGMYVLEIRQANSFTTIKVPQIPFAFQDALTYKRSEDWQTFYFNVPKHTESVWINIPFSSVKVFLTSPTGRKVKYGVGWRDGKMVKLEIKDDESGVWKIRTHKAGFKLINIPHLVSPYQKGVIK